jgi:hypothetical protein
MSGLESRLGTASGPPQPAHALGERVTAAELGRFESRRNVVSRDGTTLVLQTRAKLVRFLDAIEDVGLYVGCRSCGWCCQKPSFTLVRIRHNCIIFNFHLLFTLFFIIFSFRIELDITVRVAINSLGIQFS